MKKYFADTTKNIIIIEFSGESGQQFVRGVLNNDEMRDEYDALIAEGGISPPDGYIESESGDLVITPEHAAKLFANAKAEAKAAVLAFAENARQTLAGNPTALEASSWAAKEARARRIVAGGASESDVATVTMEANARGLGETALQLAELQVAKSNQLMAAVAVIDGMTKSALAAVGSAADSDQLSALIEQLKTAGNAQLQQLLSGAAS